jgi:hypothetical protein
VAEALRFTATAVDAGRGRILIPIPFDPDDTWGAKSRHHVNGTIGGRRFRAVLEEVPKGRGVVLRPSWCDGDALAPGAEVDVVLHAEGLQRDDLAPDLAAALAADPEAGAFFDALAQFYRKGYVQWIEATKRRPDVRAERIAEVVRLLRNGHKERPRP